MDPPYSGSLVLVTDRIAALAHDCWRLAMERAGWRPGSAFDAPSELHDALVPFDHLPAGDRQQAVLAVEAEGLQERLSAAIRYPRGADAPLLASEMRTGLAVGLAADLDRDGAEEGEITGWEVDLAGELAEVRVRWRDGTESRHHPQERELRRLDGR
jgi:hypothetical protein